MTNNFSIYIKDYIPNKIVWLITGGVGFIELFVYGYAYLSIFLLFITILICTTHYRLAVKDNSVFVSFIWILGFRFSKNKINGKAHSVLVNRQINDYGLLWSAYLKLENGSKLLLFSSDDKSELYSIGKIITQKLHISFHH